MMKVLGATHYGDAATVLKFCSADPVSCEGNPESVLIRIAYSDVNPVDLQKLSGGKIKGQAVPLHKPFVPGYGGSGIVEKTGSLVPDSFKGQRVAFLANPSNRGTYAEYCLVDHRCIAVIPDEVPYREAAVVPLAGCTAYESLVNLGLGPATTPTDKKLLIVGGAGGVGSWAIRLAKVWHPDMQIVATASSEESKAWCLRSGASSVVEHNEIESLVGVDYALCLTEPTPSVWASLTEVVRPYGCICLVVAGPSIKSLDLGFVFFKSITVVTETVFSSIRSNYTVVQPAREIADILLLLADKRITAPLSPMLESLNEDWQEAATPFGVLHCLKSRHTQGKLVLRVGSKTSFHVSFLVTNQDHHLTVLEEHY